MKLENILLDQDGYIKLIDFGLAKMLKDDEMTSTICGTPEYMAPEVLDQSGHDLTVDWWAVGILMYEMLIGVTPFWNKNRNILQMKIKNSPVVFPDRKKYKIDFSDEVVDFILSLLNKDKNVRLGSKNDFVEVLEHPYFKDFDLKALEAKQMKPPFMPNFGKKQSLKEFFNVTEDLEDTMIPKENATIVK